MVYEGLLAEGAIVAQGQRWQLVREALGTMPGGGLTLLVSDAFDRVTADDAGDLPSFDFALGPDLEIAILWARREDANGDLPVVAAVHIGSTDDWRAADWERLVRPDGRDKTIYSDGTAIFIFPTEEITVVAGIQADPARLFPLIDRIAAEGPQRVDRALVIPVSSDGGLECWGLRDGEARLRSLLIDCGVLD